MLNQKDLHRSASKLLSTRTSEIYRIVMFIGRLYKQRDGGKVDNLCLPVFLKDFVVVVKVKHKIAEIVINSIFVTRVTEPILAASDTFPTKQNIYDSFLLFAERRLFKSLMHLVPAQSRSLPQFYGEILLVNYFTKLWREVINGLRKLTVV